MAGTMIARPAAPDDAADILRLAIAAMIGLFPFPVDEGRLTDTLSAHMDAPDKLAIVAEVGGHVVGFSWRGSSRISCPGGRVAEEVGWWIDPVYRGDGWRLLLNHYEAWAKENGATSVMMPASAALPLVGNLLRRAGYEAKLTQYVKTL